MDPKAISDWLSGEIAVALHVSFWVAVVVVGFLFWKAAQREYATRLANAQSTINLLRERLEFAETSGTMLAAAATEQVEHPAPVEEHELPQQGAVEGSAAIKETSDVAEVAGSVAQKEYVSEDFNPHAVLDAFRNKTGLQAQSIVVPEIGKWMRIRGSVRAANSLPPNGGLIGLQIGSDPQLTFCVFRPVPVEVMTLDVGDIIEVEGRLDRVNGASLMLEDCALLSVSKIAQSS